MTSKEKIALLQDFVEYCENALDISNLPKIKFVFDNNIIKNFLKLFFATSLIYILGVLWLGILIGWDKPILQLGVQPFLLAELFNILIATLAINQIKKIKNLI